MFQSQADSWAAHNFLLIENFSLFEEQEVLVVERFSKEARQLNEFPCLFDGIFVRQTMVFVVGLEKVVYKITRAFNVL